MNIFQSQYINGTGHARATGGEKYRHVFGCPMIGTFNTRAPEGVDITAYKPCIERDGNRYWLVQINKERYGWAIRNEASRQARNVLEVLTRRPLPDRYKTDKLMVEIMEPWDNETIARWAKQQYWFQSFPWGPQRADSELVWQRINTLNWSGLDVLDIGCHYGYHCFQAAKAGASVVGVDSDSNCIDVAKTINDHIEMQDVQFIQGSTTFGLIFDVILYLSVHHQFDPEYSTLPQKLHELTERARKHVFVELIVPPLKSNLTLDGVIQLVGARPEAVYRHKVRKQRAIFKLEGYAS